MAKKPLHGTRLADQLLRRVVSVPKEEVEKRMAQKRAARLARPTDNPPKK